VIDPQIRVGIDVGCKAHRVGIANPAGKILEEFDISHTDAGFQDFFRRIEHHKHKLDLPVAVEGFNGYARPLDQLIQERGYTLYNVNNLKLARFKEVFPGAAKTDPIDTRKILELFHLKDHLPIGERRGSGLHSWPLASSLAASSLRVEASQGRGAVHCAARPARDRYPIHASGTEGSLLMQRALRRQTSLCSESLEAGTRCVMPYFGWRMMSNR